MTNNNLHTYLPQDRYRALASGQFLPDRTHGTALFADISGFTALTEQLRDTLGSRRGIEALTSQINAVYTALIAEVERYQGTVISFAGDAVMCWFAEQDAPQQTALCAATCALAIQAAMRHFPELGLKIAVASGAARRFVVGDPQIHYLDTLAGKTVSRTIIGDYLAHKGEVLLDEATVNELNTAVSISAWRTDAETGERFAVITHLADPITVSPLPERPELEPTQLQTWLHQPVYEREMAGQGSFLTEFRPCVALFVRFVGIDYDRDEAIAQLDAFIRQAQQIAERYDGTLLQLTIGDKGNYVYISFGALQTHEDNGRRAIKVALALREVTPLALQMGIAQGVMRVGAYGSATRRTYGAISDDVNLAARLMSQAAPGEILVSKQVQSATATDFAFKAYTAVQFKGKADPIPFFAVIGQQKQRAIRLQEPTYALPMVGRQAELQQIEEKLALAAKGQSQVIGIVAEAGLGKSRLVAELIRTARQQGFAGYGGACQSDAISTPYHAWKTVWQAFFEVDPEMPLAQLMPHLEGQLEARAPWRLAAMPLLNVLLAANMPDNDFTRTLEPKARQSALHALLEDCLKGAAKTEPLLIVIEDRHWMDALSHDLLEQLVKATATLPICFVLAYRPPQLDRLVTPRLESLPQFTRLQLQALTESEAEQAIRAKLTQLYPRQDGTLPTGLVETLMTRAQGNPFYLEELLNYVHDRGLAPTDLDQIELPDSLHTLILSRIDRLSERGKRTLRVAGIIGRLFRADWLIGYYPELGTFSQVKASLEKLHILDITPLESPEPELAYLFKHIVTHEVTYESLPFATRAKLHEQLAAYLENTYPHALPLEVLAFHYGRSENRVKQIEYLRRAGEAAQKNFASDAALDFYGTLLPLLPNDQEKFDIYLQRGEVLELMGRWADAESDYRAALELAHDDAVKKAGIQFALGKLNRQRGEYEAALNWLTQARDIQLASNDSTGLSRMLIETGTVIWRQGNYAEAREWLNEALVRAQEMGDRVNVTLAYHSLGNIAWAQGDYATARTLYTESLNQRREMGDKQGIANSLNNLGIVAGNQGDYVAARTLLEESLSLRREMGDKPGLANSLHNLGNVAQYQGDYPVARVLFEESVSLYREMGDKQGIASSLNDLGEVTLAQGDYAIAGVLLAECSTLMKEIGDKRGIAHSFNNLGVVALSQGDYDVARSFLEECLSLCREIGEKGGVTLALKNLGYLNLLQGNSKRAHAYFVECLALNLGIKSEIVENLIGLAAVAGARGNHGRAVHLAAAAETLRARMGIRSPLLQWNVYEQVVATTRAALGAEAFATGWAEGQALTVAQAVALALAA